MRKWWFILILGLCLLSFFPGKGYTQEELLSVRVIKCTRPHYLKAEVISPDEEKEVSIKLAGIRSPIERAEIYKKALKRVRELTLNQDLKFDFALGHSEEEEVWVGYLYIPEGEEWKIVNAELLREGLVELNEKTAGENMVGYLISAQEEAQEQKVGLWSVPEPQKRENREECPSCTR
ncbi:MAG TPA: thermonuclease family protein [Candidatus Atribacteria bacterium]|nr:thermonuclease family protein [Candidatus Atribacteria bacterium]